ncbi:MAG TPA: ABC transporter ATP-binding protein [Anaeromyxobacteraceae bacterium]|nr:ABC transporter ATP-binding protein [Anaeromyxobacteraceae bacterium]
MSAIRKAYRNGALATEALSGLSLRIAPGEFVAIMGPSGSGKTTFLNIAGLLDEFDVGRYALDGQDVTALSDRQRSTLRHQKIGFIFQSFNLIPDLNVWDNVELPLRYGDLTTGERRRRVERVLDLVGLAARPRALPEELSGGQQQRVAVARALVGEPRVLLADEPTGNLDSQMARRILVLLQEVNARGVTVVMVTHAPELAARAHRKVHILDGRAIDPLERQRVTAAPAGPWSLDA